jgi:hypothetical membrane protein
MTSKWLVISGLLAAPFYLMLIITLGALEPGYSHLTKPMSLLGGILGARGLAFNIGVVITGMLVIIFSYGLWRQLPAKISAKIALGLFVMGGLGLIGAGIFHCNEGCINILVEPNFVGRLHTIASLLAGMGTGLAPFIVWAAMRKSDKWKRFAAPTLAAAILANVPGIIFWITFATGYALHSIGGLIQRLGFVVTLIWMFYVAIRFWQWTSTASTEATGRNVV